MSESAVSAPFLLPERPTEPDLVAKYFRVLADVARVRVLALLGEHGEMSVGAMTDALGLRRTNLSNHLACLRWCGFVETRRAHRTVHYRIADDRVTTLLVLARALLAENADHVAACGQAEAMAAQR